MATGKVIQISGPAVDVQFPEGHLPPIYNAIRVATDGMVRGMKAEDQGGPISVPVGKETLGRVINVIGEPVDNLGPVGATKKLPIHRLAPSFEEQATSA